MNRNIRAALALVAAVLLLGGCSPIPHNDPAKPDPNPGGWFGVVTVNVNGRQVPCVTWKNGNAGGISCDWSAAR